jgi:tetratricopeptide (TPR) repeat protein
MAPDQGIAGAQGDQAEEVDYYDQEIAQYAIAVDEDLEQSLKRYGFTLYHSLPALKQVELREPLGMGPRDAIDQYNLACVAIAKEDYQEAAKLLQATLKADDKFADAVYNLALCYERLERKSDALKQWNRFLELADSEENRREVETHLAELKG